MRMGVHEHRRTLLAAPCAPSGTPSPLHSRPVLPYSPCPSPEPAERAPQPTGGPALMSTLASDLVIELENKPGALARVATAISDAGVNIAAATCMGNGNTAELHILVPHSEPVYRALANTHGPSVTREREVVVVQAQDRPGELAELATRVSEAGVNLDLVYVATNSRVVLGSENIETLKEALDGFSL
ncbi:MAG: ACT domain-containing protein [Acidimicrobiaceae bacterium]|nr:ACT domain-containing protein [Acidimicrobiaceae bacterium]MXZ66956.1 ACT domain-containing protein [Acidimicrobiaceae bacterium]MYF33603.1 ACT domain-containing protein [Acidimicrobiaceae bacterium]MYG77574.1 ACT domain-containing protein [Acidimicrobiaceae bacterium]MYJ85791.1 ACT domain-containing protein [Acidimicrobiaceae bacterium]